MFDRYFKSLYIWGLSVENKTENNRIVTINLRSYGDDCFEIKELYDKTEFYNFGKISDLNYDGEYYQCSLLNPTELEMLNKKIEMQYTVLCNRILEFDKAQKRLKEAKDLRLKLLLERDKIENNKDLVNNEQ